jgi:hypothetical protein
LIKSVVKWMVKVERNIDNSIRFICGIYIFHVHIGTTCVETSNNLL